MSVHPILIVGESVLHRRAEPVTTFDARLRALVEDMFETMSAANGVGLAAPQIGEGLRLFTWHMHNDDGVPDRGVVINPYLTAAKPARGDPDPHEEAEGCLSVPGASFPLRRGEAASVSGFDIGGNEISFEASGWFARCMQHEYDHLGGFLYTDRLNDRWSKKARKAIKANGWGQPGHSWMPGVDQDPFGHDAPDEHDL